MAFNIGSLIRSEIPFSDKEKIIFLVSNQRLFLAVYVGIFLAGKLFQMLTILVGIEFRKINSEYQVEIRVQLSDFLCRFIIDSLDA